MTQPAVLENKDSELRLRDKRNSVPKKVGPITRNGFRGKSVIPKPQTYQGSLISDYTAIK